MTDIPVGFGQATLGYSGVNLPTGAVNVIGFENAADATADDLAEDIFTQWGSNIMPNLSSGIQLTSCLVKLGPDETGPSALHTGSTAGGASADSAAPNTAFLIRKNTALGGRRGRGRMYIPGVTEAAMLSDGSVASGVRTALQTDLDAFVIVMAVATTPIVVFHGSGQTATPAPTEVVTLFVDSKLATQRRRLRR